jgi:hypothetical protein
MGYHDIEAIFDRTIRTSHEMSESMSARDAATSEQALETLGLRWRSGKFLALAGDVSFGLHLDSGRIIFATSTQRSLRLGHLLLRLGAVRPSFLERVLQGDSVLSQSATLGRALVREGAVSRADLASGVEEQAIEVLSRIIDLPDATFLHLTDDPLPAEIVIVPLETDQVLRAATIRSDHRAAVQAMQRLAPASDERLTASDADGLATRSMSESELLVHVSVARGIDRLVDLCSTLPLDPLTIKRAVIGLLERGHLVRSSAVQ